MGFYGRIASEAETKNNPIYIPDSAHLSHLGLDALQAIAGISIPVTGWVNGSPSRREFMKNIGKTLLGGYLFCGSVFGDAIFSELIGEHSPIVDSAFEYGTVDDYRNLISSLNIIKAHEIAGVEGRVPYFIGSAHVRGIKRYLENPALRIKRLAYFPQDLITRTKLEKYEFQEGVWKLTEEI